MRLHDRYLFRELLSPLGYCLGGFLVFWITYFFFSELDKMQERQLDALECAELAVAMMPGFLVMVLPITLLLSLLYALSQHARHHELTALRAAGISLWRLSLPYFGIGLAAAVCYFFLNEFAAPRGAAKREELLSRRVDGVPDAKGKLIFSKVGFRVHPGRIWQVGEYNAATRVMLNPIVTWSQTNGAWRALQAERGVRTNGLWAFYNARLFVQSSSGVGLSPDFVTNFIAMPEFDETPRQILSDIKLSDSQSLRGSRTADITLKDLRDYLRLHPELSRSDSSALHTKLMGRLAAPWTCVVVVLIAIPFGAPSGRRNLFFGVAGSIFICFSYFVIQQVCLALGMSGHLAPWLAAWLPNFVFGAGGAFLISRTR